MPERPTRERILDEAVDLFGFRGVEAVSLDEIARAVGVRKQSVLYWFPSKEALVAAVLDTVADELIVVISAAIRASDDDPLVRIDAVIRAVFGPAVRRPALLGLVRELGRLDPELVDRLRSRVQPLVEACVRYLEDEMGRGRLRRADPRLVAAHGGVGESADPRLVAALAYATVTGIATEPEALETVGWQRDLAGLRRLRDELRSFIRAALAP